MMNSLHSRSFLVLLGILSLSGILVASCGGSTDPDEPPISGIVHTNSTGTILEEDESDWQPRLVQSSGGGGGGVVHDPVGEPFSFAPAFPNPASASTRFRFAVGERARVKVWAVNAGGSAVRTFINNDSLESGIHEYEWDLKNDAGTDLPNGLYRIHLKILHGSKSTEVKSFGDVEIAR